MQQCKQKHESISKYLDFEMNEAEKREFEQHLQDCDECAQTVRQMATLKESLRELTPISVSDDFQIILRHKIRKSEKQNKYRSIFEIIPRWTIGPAVGFSLAVAAFFVWQTAADRNTGNLPGADIAEVPQQDNSQIFYVIDDNPESVMLSRNDSGSQIRNHKPDSTITPPSRNYRSHAAQVSF